MSLTLVLLVVYSLLMAGVGLWIGRHVRATGDFFVAGRSLGPTLIFATFLAGNIGAGSTVGAAGTRLSRRPERVVVERVGRHRLPRARVLGRPAHVARVGRRTAT